MSQVKSENRFLTFRLAQTRYALPLLRVQQVVEMTDVTPIPQAPAHFIGLLNLRGQIHSILNLRTKFEVGAAGAPHGAIVLLDLEDGNYVGFTVDRVDGVVELRTEDIGPPPEVLGERSPALTGVARAKDELILIVDVVRALDLEDVSVIQNHRAA